MKKIDFYVDQKVTTWVRDLYQIEAGSDDELSDTLRKIVKEGGNIYDELSDSFVERVPLDGCDEDVMPPYNGGFATQEVYINDDLIVDNGSEYPVNTFDEDSIMHAIEFALDYDITPLGINEPGHQLQLDLIKDMVVDYLHSNACKQLIY
jgi:hypothetical protein